MSRQYGLYDVPPSPSKVVFPSEVRQDNGPSFGSSDLHYSLPHLSANTNSSEGFSRNGFRQDDFFPSSSREHQERVASAAPPAQFNSSAHNFTQHLRERSPSSSSALLNLLQRYPSARQSVYSGGRIYQAEERPVDRQVFRPADASTGYPLVEVAVPKQTAAEIRSPFSDPPEQHFYPFSEDYSTYSTRNGGATGYYSDYSQKTNGGYASTFPRNFSDQSDRNFNHQIHQYSHNNYTDPGAGSNHFSQRNNWPGVLDIDSLLGSTEDAMNKSTTEWKNSFGQLQDRFRQKPAETESSSVLHGFASSGGEMRGMLTKSSSQGEIHDRSLLGHAVARAQEAPEFRRSGALDTFWSSTINNRSSSPPIHRISSNLTAAERLQLLHEPIDGPSSTNNAPVVPQRVGSRTALAARREQYLQEANSPPLTPKEKGVPKPLSPRSTPNFSDLDNAVQELQTGIRRTGYSHGARTLGGCGRFPTDESNLSPPRLVSRKYTPSPTDTTSEASSVYQVPNGLPHPKPKHNIKEQIYQASVQSNFYPRSGLRTSPNFPVPSTGSVASRITEFEQRPGTPILHISSNHVQSFDSGPMSPRSTVFRSKPVIHIDIGSSHHRPSQQANTVFSFGTPTSPRDDSLGKITERFGVLSLTTPTKTRDTPKVNFDVSASASDTSASSNDSNGVLHGMSFNRTLRGIHDEQDLVASPIVPKLPPKKERIYPPPPKFYFPQGKPVAPTDNDAALRRGCDVFRTLPGQKCRYEDMDKLCKAAGLPLYWKKPAFMYMSKNDGPISVTDFSAYWRAMTNVIHTHPGLSFYRASVEFHDKYCDVVVTRIFWNHVKAWSPHLTVDDIRRGDLLDKIRELEEEEDINKNLRYFSYEHFYVIYCLFWEIDSDHDLKIRREDLQCHMRGAIPKMVVERIFSPAVCRQPGGKITELGLVDFTHFLLADEDKQHPSSVEYWFRILDEDGDGIISLYDMENYYSGIQNKLAEENIECMKFTDVACHLIDAIRPKQENAFRRLDLKKNKLAPKFFNSFVNWRKFFDQETTEGSEPRVEDENGQELTDWDRFCAEEYEALMENQSEGENVDSYVVYLDDDEEHRSGASAYNELL